MSPFWILLGAKDDGLEVVVTTGATRRAKLQSDCHHQQTHGRRHGGSRMGKRPPWKKSGWAWPTLEIFAVV